MSTPHLKASQLLATLEAASDEALQSVLPCLVFPLLGGLPHDDLPDSVVDFFDGFSARLGIGPDTTPDELKAVLESYRKRHPVDPELMSTLLNIAKDALTGQPDDALGRAFAELIDAEPGQRFLMRSQASGEPVMDD